MFSSLVQRLRSIDWLLFAAIFFLSMIGLLMIYGISINPTKPDPTIFYKQLVVVGIGLLGYFLMSSINYRLWNVYSKVIYVLLGFVLLFVLAFGVTIRGTTGWLSLGITTVQPVEFAKIALIIILAKYFSDHGRHFFLWRHTIISGLLTLLYVGLVLKQPDFGSAIVLLGTWFLMLIIVGVPRRHLLILVTVFAIAVIAAWALVFQQYQKDRILTFFNPRRDTLGVGYNVRQSVVAVGAGQLIGRGFGLGSQSQLKFLPAAESDFIFAVLAEELGLVGVILLLAAIFVMLMRLLLLARKTTDSFAAFFLMGLASLILVQSFINIGMNMGIAPVTGIPLPFVSAGGTSMLSLFIAFGIASSIVADNRSLLRREKNQ